MVKQMLNAPMRMERLTSDPDRFSDEAAAIARNPDLAVGGVTFGWLAAAFTSIDVVQASGYAEGITTPCLFLVPGCEKLVRPQAALNFAKRMPHASCVYIRESRHELLKERDVLRREAFSTLSNFLA
jgi:lysophospholipase